MKKFIRFWLNAKKRVRRTEFGHVILIDYNDKMGGMDRKDQMLHLYLVERKRKQMRYEQLFPLLLNTIVLNSIIIYKKIMTCRTTYLEFHITHISKKVC